MHSFTGPKGTIFHFDGGLDSGNVRMVLPDTIDTLERIPRAHTLDGVAQMIVTVPVADLLALVAFQHVAPKRIQALEQARVEELLR